MRREVQEWHMPDPKPEAKPEASISPCECGHGQESHSHADGSCGSCPLQVGRSKNGVTTFDSACPKFRPKLKWATTNSTPIEDLDEMVQRVLKGEL